PGALGERVGAPVLADRGDGSVAHRGGRGQIADALAEVNAVQPLALPGHAADVRLRQLLNAFRDAHEGAQPTTAGADPAAAVRLQGRAASPPARPVPASGPPARSSRRRRAPGTAFPETTSRRRWRSGSASRRCPLRRSPGAGVRRSPARSRPSACGPASPADRTPAACPGNSTRAARAGGRTGAPPRTAARATALRSAAEGGAD